MSIYEAKLVTGASELMEPVKDGKLSVALGKPMQWHWHARNWLACCFFLRKGVMCRQGRPGPLNLPVLRELMHWKYWLARGQKCPCLEKIAGGALRGIILWQQLALPLAGLKVSRIILLMFNGRGPSAAGSQWIGGLLLVVNGEEILQLAGYCGRTSWLTWNGRRIVRMARTR